MKPKIEFTFPHGVSCADCREEKRCNHCGKPGTEWRGYTPFMDGWPDRCTNGRCPECCRNQCHHVTK